ncbi:MAG: YhgE/Pip domain-containing protein [Solirubrobacteraceae bacterium]
MATQSRSSISQAFKAPSVWGPPMILISALVFVMTLVYLGSVVNPAGHLNGLPVGIVNADTGATVGSRHVDLGGTVAAALERSPAVSSRLALTAGNLHAIENRMDLGQEYAAVLIPAGFTASALAPGSHSAPADSSSRTTIELLTNPRAGTIGVSLATGVLEPALQRASTEIGERLRASNDSRSGAGVEAPSADPVTVAQVTYRPLPSHTALGLSAFYIALLTTFCGFLGGTIVHVSIDAVLGYASTEIGPRWHQRQPVPISRWHTLVAKWAMIVPLTLILTALMLLAAVGVLNMNTPHFWELWLLTWFAAGVVGIGTLVLFAALGTLGQLIALLVFVYLALASSGGTVPLQALSGFFRFLAEFEPLRQIIDGTRSILYFNARGAAGLTRAFVASAIGLVFWISLGAAVTNWYDRKGLHRVAPATLDYIDHVVRGYHEQAEGSADPGQAPAEPSAEQA